MSDIVALRKDTDERQGRTAEFRRAEGAFSCEAPWRRRCAGPVAVRRASHQATYLNGAAPGRYGLTH